MSCGLKKHSDKAEATAYRRPTSAHRRPEVAIVPEESQIAARCTCRRWLREQRQRAESSRVIYTTCQKQTRLNAPSFAFGGFPSISGACVFQSCRMTADAPGSSVLVEAEPQRCYFCNFAPTSGLRTPQPPMRSGDDMRCVCALLTFGNGHPGRLLARSPRLSHVFGRRMASVHPLGSLQLLQRQGIAIRALCASVAFAVARQAAPLCASH